MFKSLTRLDTSKVILRFSSCFFSPSARIIKYVFVDKLQIALATVTQQTIL